MSTVSELTAGNENARLSREERDVLGRLLSVVRVFQEVNESLPVSQVATFLQVALTEGRSQREYADQLGLPQTTASRHLLDLSERNRKMEAGYGLVTQGLDPSDWRRKLYHLSPDGDEKVRRILDILQKPAGARS